MYNIYWPIECERLIANYAALVTVKSQINYFRWHLANSERLLLMYAEMCRGEKLTARARQKRLR
jgi:hypothetical protein